MEKSAIVEKIKSYGYADVSADKLYDTAMGFIKKNYTEAILDKPLGKMRKLVMYGNPNTRRNIAKAIMVFQKAMDKPEELQKASLRYYRKVYAKSMEERKTAEREKIDTSGFDEKREALEKEFDEVTEKNDAMMILQKLPMVMLMRLVADMPTRRANDYRTLLLKKPTEDPNKKNYYSNGRVYFNDFKGKETQQVKLSTTPSVAYLLKNYKKTKTGVSLEVSPELRAYFNLLRKLDRSRKYLIERGNREPYTPSMFSKFMKSTYGLTINDFRKRYIQKHVDSKAVQKAKDVAADMSNSLETQQRDYADRE